MNPATTIIYEPGYYLPFVIGPAPINLLKEPPSGPAMIRTLQLDLHSRGLLMDPDPLSPALSYTSVYWAR